MKIKLDITKEELQAVRFALLNGQRISQESAAQAKDPKFVQPLLRQAEDCYSVYQKLDFYRGEAQ